MDIEKKIQWAGASEVDRYIICVFLLQDKAGLTYREARAVLNDNCDTVPGLSQEFGISHEGVYNLVRRGMEKVNATGKTVSEICEGYEIRMRLIDPYG